MAINSNPESITELLAREDILIPRSCLEIGEKLGTGYFGCVFKGVLKLPTQQEPLDVAVKTLKNASKCHLLSLTRSITDDCLIIHTTFDLSRITGESVEAVNAFLNEALRMKDFRHDHVLALVGVCVQPDTSPMLVLPYMANGDLLSYIRAPENRPTVRQLLCYGIDVALGMGYLSALKYVHRDLAARNVMLDDRLRAKVADFGLTRDVYERSYYSTSGAAEVPVKWMSPESIEKLIATSQGDVWSYGVLLWELMTRGNHPYPLLDNSQVLECVKRGERMRRPETCPLEVYELMLDCWHLRADQRPPFDQIADRLKAIIAEKNTNATGSESSVEMQPDLLVTYANYPVEQYYNARMKEPTPVQNGDLKNSSVLTLPHCSTPITLPTLQASYANLAEEEQRKPMLHTFKSVYESEL
jgi:serine/threonine protein kinase